MARPENGQGGDHKSEEFRLRHASGDRENQSSNTTLIGRGAAYIRAKLRHDAEHHEDPAPRGTPENRPFMIGICQGQTELSFPAPPDGCY